jgi:hypothetical protein
MVVIGLWATREQSAQSAAVELHGKLDSALRDQSNSTAWYVGIGQTQVLPALAASEASHFSYQQGLMVVIGLWATREQSAQSAAVELHGKLDSALRDQKAYVECCFVDKRPRGMESLKIKTDALLRLLCIL